MQRIRFFLFSSPQLFKSKNIFTTAKRCDQRNTKREEFLEVQDSKNLNELKSVVEIEGDLFRDTTSKSKSSRISTGNSRDYEKREGRKFVKTFKPEFKNPPPFETVRKPKQKKERVESQIFQDDVLRLNYIKLDKNDPLFHSLFLTAVSKKTQNKRQLILIEGRRLIAEAIQRHIQLETLLFSKRDQLEMCQDVLQPIKNHVQIVKVPQHDLQTWSVLTTCPGLIGIFARPETLNIDPRNKLPITVICDNIREPNNLGSIIRTCAAIPCSQILVMKGCSDPWDTKSIRGAAGGQFYVNIRDDVTWETVHQFVPPGSNIFIAENNIEKSHGAHLTYDRMSIKVKSNDHNVVIIGGETHGICDQAYTFMQQSKESGSCLHIPLAEGIQSLNTASALTVILFEMRRRLLKQNNEENT